MIKDYDDDDDVECPTYQPFGKAIVASLVAWFSFDFCSISMKFIGIGPQRVNMCKVHYKGANNNNSSVIFLFNSFVLRLFL